ncbi:hypothetical protein [Terrabacter sp. NPDC080008]|uniref:hypothetical protein n=1 Tax=Terrabacter sp. NPDC080008 TaxID=3155176 RepID=UPI00344BBA84
MSSPLRTLLRARLTAAMRERDRAAVSVLRSAVAAIENAEAVPVAEVGANVGEAATAGLVAQSSLGVGSTERDRRRLDLDAEREVVLAEVGALQAAEIAYAAAGDVDRARAAADGALLLHEVLANEGEQFRRTAGEA